MGRSGIRYYPVCAKHRAPFLHDMYFTEKWDTIHKLVKKQQATIHNLEEEIQILRGD